MTELETWEANNSAYLAAALSWLRARLGRLAQQIRPAAPPVAEPPDQPKLEELADMLARAAACDPPPAMVLLGERLGLSGFEQNLLLLAVAMELDTRVATLCGGAQNDPSRGYPTFGLAFALFDDPAWEALSPERPLRYFRLLEINQPGAEPLTTSPLRADERIVSYVKGLNYLDDRLAHLVAPVRSGAGAGLPPSQQVALEAILEAATHPRTGSGAGPVVRLAGADAASKRDVAAAACAALGLRLYSLSAELLPAHAGELESLARLWQREVGLLPIALYIELRGAPAGSSPEAASQPARRFALRAGGLVFLDAGDGPATDTTAVIEIRKPTPAEQRSAWERALGGAGAGAAALLAGQFDLGLADIREIASQALRAAARGAELRESLWRECLATTRPRLDALADLLAPKATWDDIVLPESETALLRRIAGQVAARARVYDEWGFRDKMNRGLGITALFAGESGTGKTMAAEVLANELKLDLYRVDLSGVVSKYIGETEKNLRQVFDAAENGGAILFFDEADALFGKRSEVKDSHDRYANIEINYLLQRMEAYRGLAILATNMKSALDPAFMRRLRFIVNFQYPGAAERRQIWERVFPRAVPARGLDYERLAKLTLTGGNIHSIALNAAFLAAEAGAEVTMPLVLEAARTELRKLDRPVNEAELRSVAPAGAPAGAAA